MVQIVRGFEETQTMLAVLGAAIVGLTLGLFGSGGSILTVPLLVYLVDHPHKIAIAESLAIVGFLACLTGLNYQRQGLVAWSYVFLFGLPALPGAWLGVWLSQFVSGTWQLLLFAVLLLIAATLMFRNDCESADASEPPSLTNWGRLGILLQGFAVGVITGMIGVGGGFLIVPALTLVARLSMRQAMGTSLMIITMNSFTGFWKHLHYVQSSSQSINWYTIATFCGVGLGGAVIGELVNRRLDTRWLRKGFAWFLILIGLFVFWQELPRLWKPRPFQTSVTVGFQEVSLYSGLL